MKRKKLISWGLMIIWMIFIFYMSNQTAGQSSSQSNKVLEILLMLGINIPSEMYNMATFIIRKTAHFSEYFILYLLVINVMKYYVKEKKLILLSIMIVFLYAISDEVHQYFIPGRSMAMRDVLIDTFGGIVAAGFYKIIDIIKSRKLKYAAINDAKLHY